MAIKSNALILVKPAAGALVLAALLFTPNLTRADDSPTVIQPPSDAPNADDNLSPPSAAPSPGEDSGNPAATVDQSPASDSDEDGAAALTVEEVRPFDPWSQWLSGALGYFRNSGVNGASSSYFVGGGVRYGYTLFNRVFADSNRAQDAIVLEGGIFYYRVVNFLSTGDSYTLIPLIGTVRYDLAFSEDFAIFFYLGWMDNFVPQGTTAAGQQGLSLQTPAVGAGFLYRIGPNWDVRVDVGTDSAQLGLVLRF